MPESDVPPQEVPGWKPGAGLCVTLKDKTSEERPQDDFRYLVMDIRAVAQRHGFDVSLFGTEAAFAKFFHRHYNADGTQRL